MFADNQRVSGLQVERQLLLVFLGPVMIWGVAGLNGREGLCSILLGSGILCLWVFFLLRQVHVFRYPEKYWGKWMSRIIVCVCQIYLVLTGGWLVAEVGGILTKYLVQGISLKMVAGILVLAALGGCQHIQARGRFAQTVWPLVGGLTAVMMIFTIFQGDSGNLVEVNGGQQGWNRERFRNIVQGTGWFLSIFLGVGFLPFLDVQTDTPAGQAGSLFRTIGKTALWMSGVLLIFQRFFGERGRESLEYPILDLMAGVRLPGGFLRRIDLFFLTVMLFALLFTLGSIFFYSRYICERIHLPGSRIPAAVLSFLLGTVDFGRWTLVREYPKLLLYIFLPFFLGLTVCTSFLRRRIYAK